MNAPTRRLFDQEGAAELIAFTDGGSRGNPGPAGYGVVIQDQAGTTLETLAESIGLATNNMAEYRALLAALEYAISKGAARLRVYCDSELIVKQIKGEYRVQNPDLKPLHQQAWEMIRQLDHFSIEHIPREKNAAADRLANEAMDRAAGGVRASENASYSPFYAVAEGGVLRPRPPSPPLVEGAEYEVRLRSPSPRRSR